MHFLRRLGVAGVAALCMAFLPVPAAVAAPGCKNPPPAAKQDPKEPWAQRMYAPEQKVWPYSRGRGSVVAVIDTGVDSHHPQLSGVTQQGRQTRVQGGYDFVQRTRGGAVDCVPHGTGIASLIVAAKVRGIGLAGLAPEATVLPYRVSEKAVDDPGADHRPDPNVVAQAIVSAVGAHAQVINVTAVFYGHAPKILIQAVGYAISSGAVVVAPVGNGHDDKVDRSGPTDVDNERGVKPYPAALDGVLGVGAIAQDGSRLPQSQIGGYVDIVAPGGDVTTASGSFGHVQQSGTSTATAFVSATAALVFSARASLFPAGLTPYQLGRAVQDRILATAGPSLAGRHSPAYGRGLVNPYRALTERLQTGPGIKLRPVLAPPADPVAEAAAADRRHDNAVATGFAVFAGALVAVLAVGALLGPKGVRRRWRAGRAAPAQPAPDDGPEFLPGEALFLPSPQKKEKERAG